MQTGASPPDRVEVRIKKVLAVRLAYDEARKSCKLVPAFELDQLKDHSTFQALRAGLGPNDLVWD